MDVPANKVRIPDKIGLTPVSSAEKDILRAGLALPKEVTLKNGRKFHALLQVNADKRDVEFVPGQKNQNQAQRLADSRRGQTAGGGKTMTRPTRSRTKGTKATGSGNAATARGRMRTAASVPSKNGKTTHLPNSKSRITWRARRWCLPTRRTTKGSPARST